MSPAKTKLAYIFMLNTRYFCPILNKIGLYVQICIEVLNTKFAEMQPVGAQFIYADGRTDAWRDMMKLIGIFCEYVNASKKTVVMTVT